jgi:hypothetical protein
VPALRSLAAVILLISAAALAQEPDWYTVEMVLFERTDGSGPENERWPYDPGFPDLSGSVELSEIGGAGGDAKNFRRVGRQALQLEGVYRRLRNLPGIRPLAHLAWRQIGLDADKAIPVHITSGDGQQVFSGERIPTLEGTARLHRARYLHLELDLRYFRPDLSALQPTPAATPSEPEAPAGPPGAGAEPTEGLQQPTPRETVPMYFRLTESRRMRSREIHYFDHPYFGVIALITPYEPPKATTPPSEATIAEPAQAQPGP